MSPSNCVAGSMRVTAAINALLDRFSEQYHMLPDAVYLLGAAPTRFGHPPPRPLAPPAPTAADGPDGWRQASPPSAAFAAPMGDPMGAFRTPTPHSPRQGGNSQSCKRYPFRTPVPVRIPDPAPPWACPHLPADTGRLPFLLWWGGLAGLAPSRCSKLIQKSKKKGGRPPLRRPSESADSGAAWA